MSVDWAKIRKTQEIIDVKLIENESYYTENLMGRNHLAIVPWVGTIGDLLCPNN